jgi:hypothetical protein
MLHSFLNALLKSKLMACASSRNIELSLRVEFCGLDRNCASQTDKKSHTRLGLPKNRAILTMAKPPSRIAFRIAAARLLRVP